MTNPANPPATAHGITTQHRLLISRINDLVLDLNALDGLCVIASFHGHVSQLSVRVIHGAYDDTRARHDLRDIYLPCAIRPEWMTRDALKELTETASFLETLLEEKTACAN